MLCAQHILLAAGALLAMFLEKALASTCRGGLAVETVNGDVLSDPNLGSTGYVYKMEFVKADEDTQTVFALLSGVRNEVGGRLWMSKKNGDSGSWTDITTKLNGINDSTQEGIADIIVHETSDRIVVLGFDRYIWISDDDGVSWNRNALPSGFTAMNSTMRMHPFNQNVAGFVVRRKDCSDPVCPHSLLIRNNFGAGDDSTDWIDTLALSDGRISSFLGFEWGASTMYHRLDPKQLEDDRRILAQVSVKAPGAPAELHASDIHLVASNDLFDNDHETLMECVSQFIVVDDDVIVAVPAACATGDSPTKGDPHVELFVSEDEGRTFNQACVPSPDLDLMYALVELGGVDYTHIGNVLVTDHDEQHPTLAQAPVGNAYVTGPNQSIFAPARIGVFWERPFFGARALPDIMTLHGIPGTLIANGVPPEFLDGSLPSDWSKFYDEVRTYRSTNNGALWSLLTMTGQSDPDDGEPERPNFVHDACNACDPSKGACSLHLHFGSSWIFYDHPPLYSHWSAPGLLMATGNYGNSLDFSGESLCTYLSRDAGQTWQDVAMGPWMYEFGDHGGVIVIGKHRSQGLATELRFSLDFGTSWQSIKLRTPMYLENIRLEPGGRADVFVAYGTTCKASEHPDCSDSDATSKPSTIVYSLDMSDLLQEWPQCDVTADYDYWSMPKSYSNEEGCLLGVKYGFHRRKETSCCQNTFDFRTEHRIGDKCRCSQLDLSCDFTASTMQYNSTVGWPQGMFCVQDEEVPPGLCPAIVDGRYKISETLFRLIAGDQCDDSALPDIVPDTDGKGDSVHHNKHGGSGALAAAGKLFGIFIAVVAAFAAVALAVVAVMRVGPSRLTQSLSSAAGAVGSAVSGIGSRFVGPPRTPDYYTSGLDPLGDDFAGAAAGPYAPISSAPYRGSAPPALGTPSVAVGPPGGAWGASAPSGYAPPPLGVSGEGEGAGTGGGSAFGGQGGGGGHPLGDGTPLIERGSGGGTNGARDGEA